MYTYKYTPGEYLKQKESRLTAIFRSLKNTSASLGERWKAEADLREAMTSEFAWAIPNREAVETLANEKRVVEVGAGNGYWAACAKRFGCDTVCIDLSPWETTHHEVLPGDSSDVGEFADRTLFLCWPPYEDNMAWGALVNYQIAGGKRFVYVGEDRHGTTGNRYFHDLIRDDWTLERTITIPVWELASDAMYVYRRKSPR